MSTITAINRQNEREAFLRLSPLERIRLMHSVMLEMVSLRARATGASEYEIYRKYLGDNPRHFPHPPD